VGDEIADNVAWSYEQPQQPVAGIANLIAFYADRLDVWHEEDRVLG
jgi:uncharacterized protein (DUF427 family)